MPTISSITSTTSMEFYYIFWISNAINKLLSKSEHKQKINEKFNCL